MCINKVMRTKFIWFLIKIYILFYYWICLCIYHVDFFAKHVCGANIVLGCLLSLEVILVVIVLFNYLLIRKFLIAQTMESDILFHVKNAEPATFCVATIMKMFETLYLLWILLTVLTVQQIPHFLSKTTMKTVQVVNII